MNAVHLQRGARSHADRSVEMQGHLPENDPSLDRKHTVVTKISGALQYGAVLDGWERPLGLAHGGGKKQQGEHKHCSKRHFELLQ